MSNFMKIRSVGARGRAGGWTEEETDGRTDRHDKRIIALHNFANAPKSLKLPVEDRHKSRRAK